MRIIMAHGRSGGYQLGHVQHPLLVVPVGHVDGLLEGGGLPEEAEAGLTLVGGVAHAAQLIGAEGAAVVHLEQGEGVGDVVVEHRHVDRKSTRLNSSHVAISYAVFCLIKKYYAAYN